MSAIRRAREVYRQKGFARLCITAAQSIAPSPLDRAIMLINTEVLSYNTVNLPLPTRLKLYRHGFLSKSSRVYDFDGTPDEAYLSDYTSFVRAPHINGRFETLLHNKLATYQLLIANGADEHVPTIYGVLVDGDMKSIAADKGISALELLRDHGTLVCKPVVGSGSKRVLVCHYDNGNYILNGEPICECTLQERLDGLDEFLVTEYVDQAPYARDLYPKTANTIRLLTLYDDQAGEAFLAIAIQQMGIAGSEGANTPFSAGGLTAEVDRETGVLSAGAQFHEGNLRWYDCHPDTGTVIRGQEIPGWSTIRDQIVAIASELSYLPYIGWDVIVTDDSECMIIEANSHTDVDLLQIHRPLLAEDRIRQFYERQGII